MQTLKTIRVVYPDGSRPFYLINEVDFDPEIHTKYEDPQPAKTTRSKPTPPSE